MYISNVFNLIKFMKKLLIALVAILALTSCTEQIRARQFGGKIEIDVPSGYKVTSATWKASDIFYFIEPMEENYTPKEKKFIESSSYGVLETEVTFREHR
jgi:hypothetical protein